jgi:hypothetical protein
VEDKLKDLKMDGLEMYSREDIEKLLQTHEGDVKTPNPIHEDESDDAWEWEYGVPPPPTDHDEL